MSAPIADIQVQDIDHLGIVTGIVDYIGLVEEVDRPLGTDPRQLLVDLIGSDDGEVPLYPRVADGNEADKVVFTKLIQQFRAQWQIDALFVADGALYSADNLKELAGLRWVSRVGVPSARQRSALQACRIMNWWP